MHLRQSQVHNACPDGPFSGEEVSFKTGARQAGAGLNRNSSRYLKVVRASLLFLCYNILPDMEA